MDNTALNASSAAVFQTTGRRKVEITGEDGASFVSSFVKPSFLSCQWKCELVGRSSSKQDCDVMLLIQKSGWAGKLVTICDSKGQQLVELERKDFWGWKFVRKFMWEGCEYQWVHSSSCWRGGSQFTLVEATSKQPLARRDVKLWSWEHKGSITIFHAGCHIPRGLIIATAISTEKLWRDLNGTLTRV
jgi:hypothetical protein